jgi:hypothetical protein
MKSTRNCWKGITTGLVVLTFAWFCGSSPVHADTESGLFVYGGGDSESGGATDTGSVSETGGVLWGQGNSQSGGPGDTGAESDSGGVVQAGGSSESGGPMYDGNSNETRLRVQTYVKNYKW